MPRRPSRQELRDGVQIVEIDDLDGGVHVSVRDRDRERRDAATGCKKPAFGEAGGVTVNCPAGELRT